MEPPHRAADGRQRRLTRHVALLRGINVGGRNPVPMAALREAFEQDGFTDVVTYIQSGNVVFSTAEPAASLEGRVEALIERRFGFPVVVATRSQAQWRQIVSGAPDGFGQQPDVYLSDVVVLKAPLTPEQAIASLRLHPEVDAAWPGRGAIYLRRLDARRSESRLSKMTSTPEYRLMTVRNWNTTTTLLDLLEK